MDSSLRPQAEVVEHVKQIVPLLRLLSDETRLQLVLELVQAGALSVKQLQDRTGFSQSVVSHHLALLRAQQLVTVRPQGRSNFYELCCGDLSGPLNALVEALDGSVASADVSAS